MKISRIELEQPKGHRQERRSSFSMNTADLTHQSITIITEYYKNNLQPFFDALDENIIWIGPAEGQWLQGRDTLLQTWAKEQHNLTFRMSNIVSNFTTNAPDFCEVVLRYIVSTYYPDGEITQHSQCLHYTWCLRKITAEDGSSFKVPRILMLHISNFFPYDKRDTIYPVHYRPFMTEEMPVPADQNRMLVRGLDKATYFIIISTIRWMESCKNAFHTLIHTEDGVIETAAFLSSIARQYSQYFVRIHSSYLVNPHYVYKVKGLQLELRDGTVLPIPQKKYRVVKEALEKFLEQ